MNGPSGGWVRTVGKNTGGRPDLVPYLKSLTEPELAAYCSGVLSGWSHRDPEAALKLAREVHEQRHSRMAPRTKPPILCTRCGAVVPRTGKVGRPRTACVGGCKLQLVAA